MKTNPITKTEYTKLVPVIAEYRNAMLKSATVNQKPYYATVYTEQRTYGARSKFWLESFTESQLKSMKSYVAKNPAIKVGRKTYSVNLESMSWGDTALKFSCK